VWPEQHFERVGGWKLAPRELLEQWHETRGADEATLGQPKPLVLSPRRQVKKLNAQLSFMGEPADAFIHPDTAAAHGIVDGQRARVRTRRGEIVVVAKVDPGMCKGVCSIPHGHLQANVNNLTSTDDVDPLGGMARYSGVPIEIEPVT
jgi:anaerobic selenocysteine-containing dehydrogenase